MDTQWCNDTVPTLYSATCGAIGTILQNNGCWEKMYAIAGVEGPALYSFTIPGCFCGLSLAVKQLSTNQVIGRIKLKSGCCDGGHFVVTYPQELPQDHKVLLVVTMCMMHMRRDEEQASIA
jgi:hypothetical protein